MRDGPSTERLLKDFKRVLENPFWIPTLHTDELYIRTHDDHDGTFNGKITMSFDKMGDAWLICDPPSAFNRCLRFRTFGGGGNSLRVRQALMLLAEAIRLDNLERPEPGQSLEAGKRIERDRKEKTP